MSYEDDERRRNTVGMTDESGRRNIAGAKWLTQVMFGLLSFWVLSVVGLPAT